MSRKRSSFNILKDYSISSTPNQPSAEDFIITTRKRRTKVQCFCSKCNGNLVDPSTRRMKKNLQKSAILFGAKSNAYLQINRPIFAYSWLFLPIFAYLRICSKSPRIYFALRAEYPCLFLPIFRHSTCERYKNIVAASDSS